MAKAKICGLTTEAAVAAALAGGADFLGFMLFEKSPRKVNLARAAELAAPARGKAAVVAVVVDPSDALIDDILRELRPDFIQLHGAETPGRVAEIAARIKVIKVLPVAEAADLDEAPAFDGVAHHLMFDAKPPPEAERPGGHGVAYDWGLLAGRAFRSPYLLAGGLTPSNVGEALRVSGAPIVDVSSGVEGSPGLKDPALIEAFLAAVRKSPVNAAVPPNDYSAYPDARGRFGDYGGQYVPETLMPLVHDLDAAYAAAKADAGFQAQLSGLLTHYVGRPSPLYFAERLTAHYGSARIYLKREELNHTGSHKINNCVGQILLAMRMGKTRIIAETGAGQHGVATATVCARFGLPCVVYMGEVDIERQKPNVFRMNLLGAEVRPVTSGSKTLKDAMNEALRDWVTNVHDTYYLIGTAAGMHPYPVMVRDFQSVIGVEVRKQILELEGRLPDAIMACIGGGSNAIGLFHPFLNDEGVKIFGVEAAGSGVETGLHAAAINGGRPGVLHGNLTYLIQDEVGQIEEAHSISAGLDYPGIGPEHSWLHDVGRAKYLMATDTEALDAFKLCAELEGILPAIESAHALARLPEVVKEVGKDGIVVLNLSGRGDKDVATVAHHLGRVI